MAKPGPKSSYKPEYCEKALELMSQGYSMTAVAGFLGVGRKTVFNWRERFPEWDETLNIGVARRVYKLENNLFTAKNSSEVTANIFALKNACPEEWRDKQEISGPDGAPLTVQVVKFADKAKSE